MRPAPSSSWAFQQLRFIAPALIIAGIVEAGVFWWLGWGVPVSLWVPAIWVAAVASGSVAARGLGYFVLYQPAIEQKLTRKMAIIGYDMHARYIAERLSAGLQYGVSVAGIFADDPVLPGEAKLSGSITDLVSSARQSPLDAIIIALPPNHGHEGEIAGLVWRLRSVSADVFAVPYLMNGPDFLLPVETIGSMSFMVLQRRPLNERQMLCKKISDYVISLVILIPLLIICAIAAIAVKLDSPGPILFRQPRCGFNNREFTVFKFRTMYVEQTDLLAERQTCRGDPRVTRVGKWLRRLSIDELPQILNVLRGDMSLVGPRPHAPQTRIEGQLLDDVIVEYVMRYKVKPGITGWAQVNGARGELVKRADLRKRVGYDLEYIQRWSVAFDLKIISLTVWREIISKNAF